MKKRFEITKFEISQIEKNDSGKIEIKANLITQIDSEKSNRFNLQESLKKIDGELSEIENQRSNIFELSSEKRLYYNEKIQNKNQHQNNKQPLTFRIKELEELINDKTIDHG